MPKRYGKRNEQGQHLRQTIQHIFPEGTLKATMGDVGGLIKQGNLNRARRVIRGEIGLDRTGTNALLKKLVLAVADFKPRKKVQEE